MERTPTTIALGLLVCLLIVAVGIRRFELFSPPARPATEEICMGVDHPSVGLAMVCAPKRDQLLPRAATTLGLPGDCARLSLPDTLAAPALLRFDGANNPCRIQDILPLPGPMRGVAGGRFNPNTDTAADLQTLPGIGAVKARRIVEEREENGPYEDIFDLERVRGIGEKTVIRLEPWLEW